MPLYVLGLMGVTRRMSHFDDPSLQIWFQIAAFGAVLIALGIAAVPDPDRASASCRREQLRDLTGDPWNGRTLEWSTSSPPPAYNFAFTPRRARQRRLVRHEAARLRAPARRLHARSTCRRTPRAGFVLADAQHGLRLRADLAHVAGWPALAFVALIVADASSTPSTTTATSTSPPTRSSRTEGAPHAGCWPAMSDVTATLTAAARRRRRRAPASTSTDEHHPENGTLLGFWLYLMSDCLVFAVLFATYGVLGRNYAAGPSGADLFDLPLVALNTSLLLLSSITYGFAMLAMQRNGAGRDAGLAGRHRPARPGFLGVELYEFAHLIHEGAGPAAQRLPVVVLHAGRHARPARHLRHRLAGHADGAGRKHGLIPRTGAG